MITVAPRSSDGHLSTSIHHALSASLISGKESDGQPVATAVLVEKHCVVVIARLFQISMFYAAMM